MVYLILLLFVAIVIGYLLNNPMVMVYSLGFFLLILAFFTPFWPVIGLAVYLIYRAYKGAEDIDRGAGGGDPQSYTEKMKNKSYNKYK